MNSRMRLFMLATFTSVLAACGAETDGTYTPTTDTVSSASLITHSSNKIHIVTKGLPEQSKVIEDCSIGFEKEVLEYRFPADDELILGETTFELVRPLSTSQSVANIDPRLFAVWKQPSWQRGEVSYSIEVEIRRDEIIYRNTCVR